MLRQQVCAPGRTALTDTNNFVCLLRGSPGFWTGDQVMFLGGLRKIRYYLWGPSRGMLAERRCAIVQAAASGVLYM